jgi:arylsulfatase A-like enzyme
MGSLNDSQKRPNILIIVADDLGFSDTSPYGGEILTPNLSRLAKDGLRMTDFHTAPSCSPTRSMLLSGTDNHLAGLGQMAELMHQRPELYNGRPGYEGYLNFRVAALPEILQDAGYLTLFSGKWHLGMSAKLSPSARGFTHSCAFLPGAGNHYNFEPQLDNSLEKLPLIISDGFWMDGPNYIDRTRDLPSDFYSSNYFTQRMVEFLDHRTDTKKYQPFFGYLAYTAPHWPLQASQETIVKYKGKYNDGPNELRRRRLEQLQRLGLVPKDIEPSPIVTGQKEWAEMTIEERALSARKMEVYAAMVDELDQNLGKVLDKLEATGELDNTMVVFMSDNGAEGALIEAIPISRGRNLGEIVKEYYDNSLENIGKANSYAWYGPRWALAATAPSRGFKGQVTEGGIRCPCIVRYPGFSGAGGINHSFLTVMDILPTCLDLAGVIQPKDTFRGREIVPIRGKSWVPHLSNKADYVHDSNTDVMGWGLFGMQALRRGKYKAIFVEKPQGSGKWQLYDLSKDPGEIVDLAETLPDIMSGLTEEWEKYYAETGMFDDKALNMMGT